MNIPFSSVFFRPSGRRAILVLCILIVARPAFAEDCRAINFAAPPEVTFRVEAAQVAWHNDKNRDQIRILRARSGAKVADVGGHGWQSVGLTINSYILGVDVSIAALPLKLGRGSNEKSTAYCANLAKATVTFGIQRTDAYIAREYAPGSCAHGVIRDHESRHVAIYRDAVERYAPLIEQRLNALAGAIRPVRASSPQDGAERLRKLLQDDLSVEFQNMSREVERENAALDTPKAYAAERALCRQW
ncbi:MAG: hypothetical protein FJX42_01705 [Alphaproteobacteria bacterium]|nr:hypothetical protein [Alphaproteobacteria bacterium]